MRRSVTLCAAVQGCAPQPNDCQQQKPKGQTYVSQRFDAKESVPSGFAVRLQNVRQFKADGMQIAVCVAQNGRPYQEDSWLAMTKKSPLNQWWRWESKQQPVNAILEKHPTILAIFDGHGGAECSRFLTDEFPTSFEDSRDGKDPLSSALLKIDALFAKYCLNHGTVGSTATVLSIDSQTIKCANVGDSRAVLIRNSKAFDLSSDHSPALRPDEVRRIEKAGGTLSRGDLATQTLCYLATGERPCIRVYHKNGIGGLNMTRAIGDSYLKPLVIPTPELTITPRHKQDAFVVLATDGLWDVVSSHETAALIGAIQKYCNDETLVSEAAWALVLHAQRQGSSDNISVMVARLLDDTPE